MKNKIILSLITILCCSWGAWAQTVIKGQVTSSDGFLPGATVLERGTNNGTVTDVDGNFTISVSDPNAATLEIRFVGMKTSWEELKGRTADIKIKMESENKFDDVVVIGYGTQKRENLTGAIASVSGDVLVKTPAASVGEAMIGKLPGVQITQSDGSPDADIVIRVRGGGSITEDNSPLILVDGFEVSSLNDVPPSDIESIDVLKDASSTAIYGARGANGVILVTTKQPKGGKITVNINSYWQMKTLANKIDVMDPYEFVLMQYEYDRQKSSNPTNFYNKYGQAYELYKYQGVEGTDWQDEIFGSNPIARFTDFNVTGGTQKTKYKLSFANQDQPGVLIGSGLTQTNMNFTIQTELAKGLTLEYRTRFVDQLLEGDGTEGVSLLDALRQAPTEGLDDFMTLPEDNTYFDPDDFDEVVRMNPKEKAENNFRNRTRRTFNTAASLNWDIIENLSFRSEFSYEYKYEENKRFWGVDESVAKSNNNQPVIQWKMGESPRWQLNNRVNYNFTLNDMHKFNVMVGQEMKNSESWDKSYSSRYFPETTTPEKAFDNIALGTVYESSSSAGSPVRVASFFGRVEYGYNDKYLATVTARADGSTKFAKGNRWGIFPAASFAWRLSNEDFMLNAEKISNLKLRAGFGVSGNDRIGSDQYAKYYKVSKSRPVGWADNQDNYYYNFYNTSSLYNPKIKWETTITRNIGVDIGLFNGRIDGALDVYWNSTKDLLVPSDIPGHTGYTSQVTNAGQTSNRGVELSINAYIVEKKDWTLSASFNIGHNKNKIDKLSSGETEWILSSGWAGSGLLNTDDYRAYVGGTKGLMYGFVNDGFYTMDDFESFDSSARTWKLKPGVVDSSNLSGAPRPGNAKFKRLTSESEGDASNYVIGDNDRQVIGETTPDFSGGVGLNATYKNFDFSMFFNFMVGFDVFNANKVDLTSWSSNNRNNLGMEMSKDKRWRNFDDMGNEIRYQPDVLGEFNKNATIWNPTSIGKPIAMSYAVEDGSFLRLNNLNIGYTFNRELTRKIGLSKLRLYATGSNLFIITGYSGYDPEVNIETGLTPNIDYNAYPRSRAYTFGAQLTF